jgi:uncharacterized glyoxalase superfamily protein PhnB
MLNFRYTILYVDNVKETIEFYIKAFGFKSSFIHESGEYAELSTGNTKLSFSSKSLMKTLGKNTDTPHPQRPVFEIAFESEDVDKSFEIALQGGAQIIQAPRDEPWGQRTSYVSDPNGYLIEICSPIGTHHS